jgi:hypothetical protein
MNPTIKNIEDLDDKLWYIVNQKKYTEGKDKKENNNNRNRENNNDSYFINKDDIIKFGDVKYYVKEINLCDRKNFTSPNIDVNDISKLNKNTLPLINFKYMAQIPNKNSQEEEDKLCKFCYQDSNDKDNQLVNICGICNGGIKYIHYICLKKWIESNLEIDFNFDRTVKSYNIDCFNCDICKTPYPSKFNNLI